MAGAAPKQPSLIDKDPPVPEGFRYQPEILSAVEENELIAHIRSLPLKEFEFHGYTGKRRTISFGFHYDFSAAELQKVVPIPEFLSTARERAAVFAGLAIEKLSHALVTEYRPGTPIGWHRDKAVFEDVVGISLGSSCRFRFRRKSGSKWERRTVILEPRSAYLLRGPARTEWEHSIPEVDQLRYSITFRTLR